MNEYFGSSQVVSLLALTVNYHDTTSQWTVTTSETSSIPAGQLNTTAYCLLDQDQGQYPAGLYYWPGTRWLYALTAPQVSQCFLADFTVDLYYRWTQSVTPAANAKVYRNTFQQADGTTIPPNSPYCWVVLTPASSGGGGSGTVTSVNVTPPSIMEASGGPITSSGTIALSLKPQAAGMILSGPSTGPNAVPTFRTLSAQDLVGTGALTTANVKGTTNQIVATVSAGNVVLSTPQDIDPGANVNFLSLTSGSFVKGQNFQTDSASNNIILSGSALVGTAPQIVTFGADTNIGLDVNTKGTGVIGLHADTAVTGRATIDSGDTLGPTLLAKNSHSSSGRNGKNAQIAVEYAYRSATGMIGFGMDNLQDPDSRWWDIAMLDDGPLAIRAVSNDSTGTKSVLVITRNGLTITGITSDSGTGSWTHTGDFNITGTLGVPNLGTNGANNVALQSAATGAAPKIVTEGADANIDLDIALKGTGTVNVTSPVTANKLTINTATLAPSDAGLALISTGVNNSASLLFTNEAANPGGKSWALMASTSTGFVLGAVNDLGSVSEVPLMIGRNGVAVTSITSNSGTGAWAHTGLMSVTTDEAGFTPNGLTIVGGPINGWATLNFTSKKGAVDTKNWNVFADSSGHLMFTTSSDDNASSSVWLRASRTGITISGLVSDSGSGNWTHTGGMVVDGAQTVGTTTASLLVQGSAPVTGLQVTGGSADQNIWTTAAVPNGLTFTIVSDDGSQLKPWVQVGRTGMTIDSIRVTGTAIALDGATSVVGALTASTSVAAPVVETNASPNNVVLTGGSVPTISVSGTGTNVDLDISAKGTGKVNITSPINFADSFTTSGILTIDHVTQKPGPTSGLIISSTGTGNVSALSLYNGASPADTKWWNITVREGGTLSFDVTLDDGTVPGSWLEVTRTGNVINGIKTDSAGGSWSHRGKFYANDTITSGALLGAPVVQATSATNNVLLTGGTTPTITVTGTDTNAELSISAKGSTSKINITNPVNLSTSSFANTSLIVTNPSGGTFGGEQSILQISTTGQRAATGMIGLGMPAIPTVDSRWWDIGLDADGPFVMRAVNDAGDTFATFLRVTRTGTTITAIETNSGSGAWTHTGELKSTVKVDAPVISTSTGTGDVVLSGGSAASIRADGTPANIDLDLQAKGTGHINSSAPMWVHTGDFAVSGTFSSLNIGTDGPNNVMLHSAVSGSTPQITTTGIDGSIDLDVSLKGTGTLKVNNQTVVTTATTNPGPNSGIVIQSTATNAASLALQNVGAGVDQKYWALNGGSDGSFQLMCVSDDGTNGTFPLTVKRTGYQVDGITSNAGTTGWTHTGDFNVSGTLTSATSSANNIALVQSATGIVPQISVGGVDANVGLRIVPKGTGGLNVVGPIVATGAVSSAGMVSSSNITVTGGTNPATNVNGVNLWYIGGFARAAFTDAAGNANSKVGMIQYNTGTFEFGFGSDLYSGSTSFLSATGGFNAITGVTSSSGSGSWKHTGLFSVENQLGASGPGSNITVTGAGTSTPSIGWGQTAASANNKWYSILSSASGQLVFNLVNDTNTAASSWLTVSRNQMNVSAIESNSGTGNWTHTGSLVTTGSHIAAYTPTSGNLAMPVTTSHIEMFTNSANSINVAYVDGSRTANNRVAFSQWLAGGHTLSAFANDQFGSAIVALKVTGGQASGITGITSNSGSGQWTHTGKFHATGGVSASPLSEDVELPVPVGNSIHINGSPVGGPTTIITEGDDQDINLEITLKGNGTFKVNAPVVSAGLQVQEGTNAKQGVATLGAGTVTVANTSVTANSRIFLTGQDDNVKGALRVSARVAGTSFSITSNDNTDTGVVAYQIFEPAV